MRPDTLLFTSIHLLWRFLMSEVPLYSVQITSKPFKCPDHNEELSVGTGCRGTSLIRNSAPLEPYRRPMPSVLGGSSGWARYPCRVLKTSFVVSF